MFAIVIKYIKIAILILIPIFVSSFACDLLNTANDFAFIVGLLMLIVMVGYIIYFIIKLYHIIEEKSI